MTCTNGRTSPASRFGHTGAACLQRGRKGMVYTLSVFLLVAVLLALMAFWVEQTDRRRTTLDAPIDADVLADRVDDIGRLTMQALGVNASITRNNVFLLLDIADEGFPLSSRAGGQGMTDLLPLKNWLESNWASTTHANITYNFSAMNSSGAIMQTTASGLMYSHDNSNAGHDSASLFIPQTSWGAGAPNNLTVSLSCTPPHGAIRVDYTDWSGGGTTFGGTIRFYDFGVWRSHTAILDPGVSDAFSARYIDISGNWMQTLHVDWAAPDTLNIYGENNATYSPALTKDNVSCGISPDLKLAYSGGAEENIFIPLNLSLRYYNASYNGFLVLMRK